MNTVIYIKQLIKTNGIYKQAKQTGSRYIIYYACHLLLFLFYINKFLHILFSF
ncbi:hypothetical protein BDF21DRAFT_417340, partial [Thamnidium elegans]